MPPAEYTLPAPPPDAAGGIPLPIAGRYVLGAEIARGGMGAVYRADDTVLGRVVAIKLLPGGCAPTSGSARRFADEARITGQLQHPNIPAVFDLGTFPDGGPFLAMKLINGETLDELLKGRPDPAHDRGRFVAAFEKVCEAVAYAHAHDVIHRDLKPGNVMLGRFGEVQVMDWGLAKVLAGREGAPTAATGEATLAATAVKSLRDTDDQFTQDGSVLGTPAYMPPEQAIGAIDQIDRRSDVFGLGGILAAILTGRPPFAAGTTEGNRQLAARGKVGDCFARLDASGADPELVALCKRCLAAEKDDRPADAGAVADAVAALRAAADERARQADLDRVRAEGETAAAEARAAGERAAANLRAAEQRRRARLWLALSAAVGVLVIGGVGFAWYLDRQATKQEQERIRLAAAKEQERAEQERKEAEARATARQNLEAALDRAAAALREDKPPAAGAALDRAADLLAAAAAADLQKRYADLRADQALAVELDRVWSRASAVLPDNVPGQARRTSEGLRFDDGAARTGYPAALAARGLALGTGDLGGLADRIARSPIRDRLVAALDDWLPVARPEDRARLCDLLARIDPHAARTAIRRAHTEPATLPDALQDPPVDALRVAARAAAAAGGADPRVRAILQTAAARHSDDFRIQYAAGVAGLRDPARFEAAVGHLRVAASLRPDNLAALYTLGSALYPSRRMDEAVGYLLRATELDPRFAPPYIGLADAIKNGADPAPAVKHFEREIARDPNSAMAHFGLGMALRDTKPREAERAFVRSIALDDTFSSAHNYLGYVLNSVADTDRRIAAFRKAIALDPTFAFPHYNLGNAYRATGDLPAAEAEYRKAIELFPEHAFSHFELGNLLARQKKADKAAERWREVIRISPNFYTPSTGSPYAPLGRYLLQAGQFAEAAEVYAEYVRRFPAEFAGYDGYILAVGQQGRHVEVVQAYAGLALRGGFPKAWSADLQHHLRYNAACSAALAGVGQAKDAPPDADRVLYRVQALAWLRANLAELRKSAGSPAAVDRKRAAATLEHWLTDSDLSALRPGPNRVGPAAEAAEWDAFWTDVRAAIAEAGRLPREVAPPPRRVG